MIRQATETPVRETPPRPSPSLGLGGPLKSLAQIIVSCADLLEAEGRTLRQSALRLGVALALVAVTAILTIGGIGLLIVSLYLALAPAAGPALAAAAAALVTLIAAGALLWIAYRHNR